MRPSMATSMRVSNGASQCPTRPSTPFHTKHSPVPAPLSFEHLQEVLKLRALDAPKFNPEDVTFRRCFRFSFSFFVFVFFFTCHSPKAKTVRRASACAPGRAPQLFFHDVAARVRPGFAFEGVVAAELCAVSAGNHFCDSCVTTRLFLTFFYEGLCVPCPAEAPRKPTLDPTVPRALCTA